MKLFAAVSLATALVLSPAVATSVYAAPAASAQQQTLRAMQKLEVTTYKALHSYLMYVVQERAPAQQKRMNEFLSQGDALVAQLANPAIQTNWTAFRQAAATDPYTNGDVAQVKLYAAEDTATALIESIRSASSAMRTASRIPVSKDADSLFELSTLMEKLSTIYLRNSADPLGGANYSGANKQLDPAIMANQFSQLLAQSRTAYKNNAEISKSLAQVFQKWNFIHGRMTDFNQKTVPFIVEKYNEQITQRLAEAYELALK